tara:strand:- start:586 stop:1554 length:969 start_codon:yes stop_codon:yes gene_type:complete
VRLNVEKNSFKLKKIFTISRGSRTSADVITVTIRDKGLKGWAECVPYKRYNESLETVIKQIKSIKLPTSISQLQESLAPGAARNAVDCALWDLEAKITGMPVWKLLGIEEPEPSITAYTISLDAPENMEKEAQQKNNYPILKVKLGGSNDENCIRAVRKGSPKARIIVDANEGWTPEIYTYLGPVFKNLGVELVEQPFPAGKDSILRSLDRILPVCADESCHDLKSLDDLLGLYDFVNIKLDKTGGLTEAIKVLKSAREKGFKIMLGCMVGSSLAMAPAMLLAHMCDFVDLDGPLLLDEDRPNPLIYDNHLAFPPESNLWGH